MTRNSQPAGADQRRPSAIATGAAARTMPEHAGRRDEDEAELLRGAERHVLLDVDHVMHRRVLVVDDLERPAAPMEHVLVHAPLEEVREEEHGRDDEPGRVQCTVPRRRSCTVLTARTTTAIPVVAARWPHGLYHHGISAVAARRTRSRRSSVSRPAVASFTSTFSSSRRASRTPPATGEPKLGPSYCGASRGCSLVLGCGSAAMVFAPFLRILYVLFLQNARGIVAARHGRLSDEPGAPFPVAAAKLAQ